jgi:hypothetical protein
LVFRRQAGLGASPEGLMQKLEEEVKVNMYIVRDRLPKELENRQKAPTSLFFALKALSRQSFFIILSTPFHIGQKNV